MNTASYKTAVGDLLHRGEPLTLTAGMSLPDGAHLVPITNGNDVVNDVVLVGRAEGRRLLPLLVERLEALPPRAVLPIDVSNVAFADISYCDESFTKLARRRAAGEYPDRYFVLTGVAAELESNLEVFFAARGVAVPIRRRDTRTAEGEPDLLGEVGPEMRDTYRMAARWGRITARQLIDEVGEGKLAIAASSNRLTRLSDMGALAPLGSEIMEGGGRQKVFAPVV